MTSLPRCSPRIFFSFFSSFSAGTGETQGFSHCQVPKVKRIIDFILRNIRPGTCVLSVAQLNCDTLADLVIAHFPEICPRKQNGTGPAVNETGSPGNYAGSPRFHILLPSQVSLETFWASRSYIYALSYCDSPPHPSPISPPFFSYVKPKDRFLR